MSKTASGSGKGSKQKPKTGQTTETGFKGKYTECNKELKTAKAKISSLETELRKCRFDLLSLRTNFNYEEVRKQLSIVMDNDGLQADQNARFVAEINDLKRQLEKQNKNQNQSRNKIPTLEREKAALEREKITLDKEVNKYKTELASFSELKDEKNKMLQTIDDLNRQLQLLGDENTGLKAKTQQKPRQKSELEKEKERLEKQLIQSKDDFQRLKSEKEAHMCKKDESNESTNDKSRADLEAEKEQLQEQLQTALLECDRLKKESKEHISRGDDNDPGVDQMKKKERDSKDQLNKLKRECEEKEKAQRESEDLIKELKKEICDITKASQAEKEKDERSLGDLKEKLDSKNIEIDELNVKLKGEHERLTAQIEQNRCNAKEVENKQKEIEDLKTRLKDQAQRKHGNSRENELIEEIEKLKSRLSQMAGAQLMTNNPNIADLSDVNRPTKIAEQYTELYDNEWTNVFEILEKVGDSEPKIVDTLYKMLVDSFRYCEEKSVEQTKQLKLSLTSVQKKGDVISDDKIVPTKLRQLRELRKAFAPDMIESIFEAYTKDKKPKHINRPEMKEFVHKCITLCWFMAVQDPPVVIDTKNHTGTFNGDLFRTYTTTGKKIAFIVWPPLYLHDGGPMLSKGIAQGK